MYIISYWVKNGWKWVSNHLFLSPLVMASQEMRMWMWAKNYLSNVVENEPYFLPSFSKKRQQRKGEETRKKAFILISSPSFCAFSCNFLCVCVRVWFPVLGCVPCFSCTWILDGDGKKDIAKLRIKVVFVRVELVSNFACIFHFGIWSSTVGRGNRVLCFVTQRVNHVFLDFLWFIWSIGRVSHNHNIQSVVTVTLLRQLWCWHRIFFY